MNIPDFFVVEVTNRCNIRCPACPWHTCMQRKIHDMSIEEYLCVLEKIAPYAKAVCLYVMGEPLLNPDIKSILQETNRRGIRTIISSNGMLIEKNLDMIFEAKLDHLQVALDGFSKKTHEAYRVGSDFTKVISNLELLAYEKNIRQSSKPEVEIQTLVNHFNENEIPQIEEFCSRLGFRFHTKKMHYGRSEEVYNRNIDIFKPSNDQFLRTPGVSFYGRNERCPELEKVVILSNGVVVPCCIDYDGKNALGNIYEQSLEEIWQGEARRDFLKHYRDHTSAFCEKCDMI